MFQVADICIIKILAELNPIDPLIKSQLLYGGNLLLSC